MRIIHWDITENSLKFLSFATWISQAAKSHEISRRSQWNLNVWLTEISWESQLSLKWEIDLGYRLSRCKKLTRWYRLAHCFRLGRCKRLTRCKRLIGCKRLTRIFGLTLWSAQITCLTRETIVSSGYPTIWIDPIGSLVGLTFWNMDFLYDWPNSKAHKL